ncbi:MAG: hypothetical protein RMM58_13535 [Chloroflexota bacterium]|nr:hypothetical protein [Chloroflexota bacterium]
MLGGPAGEKMRPGLSRLRVLDLMSPVGTTATKLLADRGAAVPLGGRSGVGRVLLLEFAGTQRRMGRRPAEGRYSSNCRRVLSPIDIAAAMDTIAARGSPARAAPTLHEFGTTVGAAARVVAAGPAGTPIHLVQLDGAPETVTGRMRRFVEEHGPTRTGFADAASAAIVRGGAAAARFSRAALGHAPVIDEELNAPETTCLLCLAARQTRVISAQGAHEFGKAVVSRPLNSTPRPRPSGDRPDYRLARDELRRAAPRGHARRGPYHRDGRLLRAGDDRTAPTRRPPSSASSRAGQRRAWANHQER